jgi:ElaB/YqjD/DUF883 family membrane-anchored ribosome-binding protein
MSDTTLEAREQLLTDLKAVVADSEELLRATAGAVDERASAARARITESLRTARARLDSLDDEVLARVKDATKAADDYVHEHPWGAVGVAAAVGLLAGVLIARR